jgi:CRP-like cAMP-binding protein
VSDLEAAVAVLSRRGWLSEQPADLRDLITGSLRPLRVSAGGTVYSQGDPPDGIYGLAAGQVKVSVIAADGTEVVGGIIVPGGWFGELSVFDGLPRPQSAIVTNNALLVRLPGALFKKITAAYPQYLPNFIQIMARNFRSSSIYRYEVLPAPASQRVVRLMLLLADEEIRGNAFRDIVLDIGQDHLAKIAGLSRQTVNRVLNELAKQDLVKCRYGRIVLCRRLLRTLGFPADGALCDSPPNSNHASTPARTSTRSSSRTNCF